MRTRGARGVTARERATSDGAPRELALETPRRAASLQVELAAELKPASPFGLSIEIPVDRELRLPASAVGALPPHSLVRQLSRSQLQTPLTTRAASLGLLEADDAAQASLQDLVRAQDVAALRAALADRRKGKVNRADEDGYTPLMVTAALETPLASAMAEVLVAAGAELERTDNEGFTALHWAAAVGTRDTLRVLGRAGAKVNASSRAGDTPLHRGSLLGREENVATLVDEFHANARLHNAKGELPSQLACDLLRDGCGSAAEAAKIALTQQRIHRILLLATPELVLNIYYHPDCMEHIAGTMHQESPRRLEAILDALHSSAAFALDEALAPRRLRPPADADRAAAAGEAAGLRSIAAAARGHRTNASSCLNFVSDFEMADLSAVTRIHSEQYVTFVRSLADSLDPEEAVPFTPRVQRSCFGIKTPRAKPASACDTSFSKATLRAALRACGAAIEAVDRVLQPELGFGRRAFCCVRPPGHHAGVQGLGIADLKQRGASIRDERPALAAAATPFSPRLGGAADPARPSIGAFPTQAAESTSCGFCIFNNVCVAAAHALSKFRVSVKRVAIIDIDVHHGNGTEEIVKLLNSSAVSMGRAPSIMFSSAHLFDRKFYPATGQSDDLCQCCMNLPLHPLWEKKGGHHADDAGRSGWRHLIKTRLLFSLRCFHPDLILVSAGFDGAKGDIGNRQSAHRKAAVGLDLRPADYRWFAQELRAVASVCCDGRIVSVLEGGYGSMPPQPSFKGAKANGLGTAAANGHAAVGTNGTRRRAAEADAKSAAAVAGPPLGTGLSETPPRLLDLGNFSKCVAAFVSGLAGTPTPPAVSTAQSATETPCSGTDVENTQEMLLADPDEKVALRLPSPGLSEASSSATLVVEGSPNKRRLPRSRTPPRKSARARKR